MIRSNQCDVETLYMNLASTDLITATRYTVLILLRFTLSGLIFQDWVTTQLSPNLKLLNIVCARLSDRCYVQGILRTQNISMINRSTAIHH